MSIKANEVLDLLDQFINNDPLNGLAPMMFQLWTHFFPADTCLSVFRSKDDWVVFVEIVCFRPGAEDSSVETWGYGNCLSESALLWGDTPYEFCPAAGEDGEDSRYSSYPDTPFKFCIVRDGEHLEFSPSTEEYADLGIVIAPDITEHGDHIGGHVLRFLCERLSHPFFTSEAGLRQLMEENWREGEAPRIGEMALLWQTQRWRHPAIPGQGVDEERPRNLPYFQVLARAIETGDVAELESQDPTTFNTDWRIWDAEEREEDAQAKAHGEQQQAQFAQLPPEIQEQMHAMGVNVTSGMWMVETVEEPER